MWRKWRKKKIVESKKISEELDGAKTVAIAGHVRPDGDCVGSCMAMMGYLKDNFKQLAEVDVYLEEIPDCFHILRGVDQINHSCEEEKTYDLFIALDCADKARLGGAVKYFDSAAHTLCYDHHISNPGFADKNYIYPDSSSTAEVIYHVMEDDKITKETAEALYTGLVHDTGIFQYSCTRPETLEIAANLLRKGIDGNYISDTTFSEKTYVQNQILGRALLESILVLDKTCIVSGVRQKDMGFYGVKATDLDGIVSQLRLTKGVETAIFLHELAPLTYKVSLRSKSYVDVSVIAAAFGGGGHVRAAGCTMHGTFHDVVNSLTEKIEIQMKEKAGA